ncbi:MAG: CHAT domain-containing protein [Oscillochloridaceae bacterium umkhey_bin13]
MATLEITVRMGREGGWPVVADFSSSDDPLPSRDEGFLQLDLADLREYAYQARRYGEVLGAALFKGPIRSSFERALAKAGTADLHLLLFVEDPALRQIRWERLCVPADQGWQLLATYQRVPFVRYLPSQTDRRFPPIARHDLRALVVAASPATSHDDWGLPLFDELAAVQGVLNTLQAAGIPSILLSNTPEAHAPPTLAAIRTQISQARITMLHVVAHGRFSSDGAVLYLSHPDNPAKVDPISTNRLIEELNDLKGAFGLPHLTFLCTCESAQEDHNGAFGGLGQQLVLRLGMPAVVAMADRVSVATATELAAGFYQQLLDPESHAGAVVARALVTATAGLADRDDITAPVLFSRLGARPLFSQTAQRPPNPREITSGIASLRQLVNERAPSLRNEFERAAGIVLEQVHQSEDNLSPQAREALQQARDTLETICGEAAELTFTALATGARPAPYEGTICPFPGLAPFTEQQQRFFLGRDRLADQLISQLEVAPFLALVGPSGSGKSSLVQAGLVPRLRALYPNLGVAYLRPGDLPGAELELAIHAARQGGADRLVVVVDQLEALFLARADEHFEREERGPFLAQLVELAREHLVIVTLRADALAAGAHYPHFQQLLVNNTARITPLDPEALRSVAEAQAAEVGLRFEAGLAELILNDVRSERGVMPLLQHVLRELWQRRLGRWLRIRAYVELGGVKEAIARTAEQIFAQHSRADQERLREIFLRLTRLDRDPAAGDQPADTRQRVVIEELVPAGSPRERTETLLSELTAARLVISDGTSVEVAHEALIRSWQRLRQWISDDRQLLLQLDRLRQASLAWERSGEDPDLLWKGQLLVQAELLDQLPRLALNAQEKAFIAAGVEARRREQEAQLAQLEQERRLRAAAEAERQRAEEEAARAVAAAVAAEQARSEAAQARLIAEGQADEARRAREEATIARMRAEDSNQRAVEEAERARTERDRALKEEARALSAEQQVRAKARALTRRLWALGGLTLFATLLAGVIIGQFLEIQRTNTVNAALAAYSRGELDQALLLAQQVGADPRLSPIFMEVANNGSRYVLEEFESLVRVLTFNADGSRYLAADEMGALRIWDYTDGRLLREHLEPALDGRIVWVLAAIFVGDDVVFGTSEGQLASLNASSTQPFDQVADGMITALAASPDGNTIISGDDQGTVLRWDRTSHTLLERLIELPGEAIVAVNYLNDLNLVLVADTNSTVYLFNTTNWALEQQFSLARPDAPDLDGDFEPDVCLLTALTILVGVDAPLIVSGCDSGAIEAWSLDGSFIADFVGHDNEILSLAAMPPEQGGFVSSSFDQSVRLWRFGSLRTSRVLPGHASEVYSIAVSPDGSAIITGAYDGSLRFWDSAPGLFERDFELPGDDQLGNIRTMVILADGGMVVGDINGLVARWDAADQLVQTRLVPGSVIALSADGQRALVQLPDNQVAFWDVTNHQQISSFPGELVLNQAAALNADGSLGFFALQDATGSELRQADGTLIERFDPGLEVPTAAVFSPDQTHLWMSYGNGDILQWSLAERAWVGKPLPLHRDQVESLVISPDGRYLLSGSWDKTAILWDLEQPSNAPKVLRSHTRTIRSVAFSPDGRYLLTGGDDRNLFLWDAATGRLLGTLDQTLGLISEVHFSRDGRRALVGSLIGELRRSHVLTGNEFQAWLRENRAVP